MRDDKLERKITSDEITTFCGASGDSQWLHNVELMREKGKYPIVPGIMTLMYSLMPHLGFMRKPTTIDAFFPNRFLSAGETIVVPDQDQDVHELLANTAAGDPLFERERGRYSGIYNDHPYLLSCVDGRAAGMEPEMQKVGAFQKLFGFADDVGPLFYAMAYSSHVLLQHLSSPRPGDETTLVEEMGRAHRPIIPVETGVHYHLPKGIIDVGDARIAYSCEIRLSGKRDASARVAAEIESGQIFSAKYDLLRAPGLVVLNGAKPLRES
ncbi:MAG: hypothetical protein QS99_C0015G0046 [archaeon GW2011_AR4]|nr:MAG: hypothetical protein QS99_C0015G0046 [archaeon GW2011_AR4]